jgi:hypothetical protein
VTVSSSFPSQDINFFEVLGEARWATPVSLPGDWTYSVTSFTYYFTHPSSTASTPRTIELEPVRCDLARPGASYVGCVYPAYRPTHVVESYLNPQYALHIHDAQASGLRGAPGGNPLTRLTDPSLVSSNGWTACRDRDTYPRPTGFECDEYPYRSTYEGAFTGGGSPRTHTWCQIPTVGSGSGPVGFSICMIPGSQNSSGGSVLGQFYRSERVIDGDQFYVLVI